MRIETYEDALNEIHHALADHLMGRDVDFPQLLEDLERFMLSQQDVTFKIEEFKESLDAIEEAVEWVQNDLTEFERERLPRANIFRIVEVIEEFLENISENIGEVCSRIDEARSLIKE